MSKLLSCTAKALAKLQQIEQPLPPEQKTVIYAHNAWTTGFAPDQTHPFAAFASQSFEIDTYGFNEELYAAHGGVLLKDALPNPVANLCDLQKLIVEVAKAPASDTIRTISFENHLNTQDFRTFCLSIKETLGDSLESGKIVLRTTTLSQAQKAIAKEMQVPILLDTSSKATVCFDSLCYAAETLRKPEALRDDSKCLALAEATRAGEVALNTFDTPFKLASSEYHRYSTSQCGVTSTKLSLMQPCDKRVADFMLGRLEWHAAKLQCQSSNSTVCAEITSLHANLTALQASGELQLPPQNFNPWRTFGNKELAQDYCLYRAGVPTIGTLTFSVIWSLSDRVLGDLQYYFADKALDAWKFQQLQRDKTWVKFSSFKALEYTAWAGRKTFTGIGTYIVLSGAYAYSPVIILPLSLATLSKWTIQWVAHPESSAAYLSTLAKPLIWCVPSTKDYLSEEAIQRKLLSIKDKHSFGKDKHSLFSDFTATTVDAIFSFISVVSTPCSSAVYKTTSVFLGFGSAFVTNAFYTGIKSFFDSDKSRRIAQSPEHPQTTTDSIELG